MQQKVSIMYIDCGTLHQERYMYLVRLLCIKLQLKMILLLLPHVVKSGNLRLYSQLASLLENFTFEGGEAITLF